MAFPSYEYQSEQRLSAKRFDSLFALDNITKYVMKTGSLNYWLTYEIVLTFEALTFLIQQFYQSADPKTKFISWRNLSQSRSKWGGGRKSDYKWVFLRLIFAHFSELWLKLTLIYREQTFWLSCRDFSVLCVSGWQVDEDGQLWLPPRPADVTLLCPGEASVAPHSNYSKLLQTVIDKITCPT